MSEQLGVIGLAVMGENLVLNLADHGMAVAVYNRTADRTRQFLTGAAAGKTIAPTYSLTDLVGRLQRPRRLLLMVKAGAAVDAVLGELVPLLEKGDIVIDGGNSFYRDTERRHQDFTSRGFQYVGMGVSGGEEGARHGPSLMPGGPRAAIDLLEPMLKKIAAQTDSGPCVTYVGARSAGHFVKMVHNGIEYGDMQLIAESYDLLRRGAGLSGNQLAAVFHDWNQGDLKSYLIEITAHIVAFADDQNTGTVLIDRIEDRAGQKGTGKWTTQAALDLGLPIPTITAAVDARLLSALKEERLQASKLYEDLTNPELPPSTPQGTGSNADFGRDDIVSLVRQALYAAKICSYAQGFAMLAAASKEFDYGLNVAEVARIWKGGCIIRAVFLDHIRAAFERDKTLPNLLLDADFAREISDRLEGWRKTVALAQRQGIPVPALSASLAYFDGYRSPRLPAYLIQAQRDFFGAHTYERTDRPGVFHTQWSQEAGKTERA